MAFYRVEVTDRARKEIRSAPGHLRSRILEVLHLLEQNFNPPGSRQLDLSKTDLPAMQDLSLGRARLDTWRIIYAVDTKESTVFVLGVRRRPPYQYEDLQQLIRQTHR